MISTPFHCVCNAWRNNRWTVLWFRLFWKISAQTSTKTNTGNKMGIPHGLRCRQGSFALVVRGKCLGFLTFSAKAEQAKLGTKAKIRRDRRRIFLKTEARSGAATQQGRQAAAW
jgi:hypothetical protein